MSFPVAAIPGVGHMSGRGEDEKEEAQVLHVTATQRLVVTVSGNAGFGNRLGS